MRAAPPGGEWRLGRPPGASIFRARCAGFSESYIRNLMFFHEPHGRKGLGSESGGKSCALILPYVAIASGMAKPISSALMRLPHRPGALNACVCILCFPKKLHVLNHLMNRRMTCLRKMEIDGSHGGLGVLEWRGRSKKSFRKWALHVSALSTGGNVSRVCIGSFRPVVAQWE
jgi:hypothetical protein